MQWFRLRPTFEIPLVVGRASASERLKAECDAFGTAELFMVHGEYGELHLPLEQHRLWSPHLSFYLVGRDQNCILHGRYAPRINVWTCVWCVYLAMAFTIFFALTLAYSQWMLGTSAWGLGLALGALLVLLILYVVAHIGQQLSADQMLALRTQLEEILTRQRLV